MDQSTKPVHPAQSPTNASTNATPSDIESIVADAIGQVESLNALTAEAVAATAAKPAPVEPDFAEMERQIQSLLDGSSGESTPGSAEAAKPAEPSRDIRTDSIEEEPVDPLLKEIDAALADDADALLKGADGDIGQAIRSVFDERALSGQEEDVNRALIEAFGTSRVENPSFESSTISNPLPGFDGSARELSPDIPREDRDRAQQAADHPKAHSAPIAEEPPSSAQPATEAATIAAAAEVHASRPTEAEQTATKQPTVEAAPSHAAQGQAAVADAKDTGASIIESKSDARPSRGLTEAIGAIVVLPIKLLGAPTRVLPGAARTIVGIAAVTLALWTPAAWWFAVKSAKIPAVAPITIKPAPEAPETAASSGGGHGAGTEAKSEGKTEAKTDEPASSGGGHH